MISWELSHMLFRHSIYQVFIFSFHVSLTSEFTLTWYRFHFLAQSILISFNHIFIFKPDHGKVEEKSFLPALFLDYPKQNFLYFSFRFLLIFFISKWNVLTIFFIKLAGGSVKQETNWLGVIVKKHYG